MKLLQFPLTRITIGFILGLCFCLYAKPAINLIFGITFFVFLVCIFARFTAVNRVYFGLSTSVLSFCMGMLTQIVHTDTYQKNHYTHYTVAFEKPQILSLVIREQLKSTLFNNRYIALINQIGNQKTSGKIILNIPKDSLDPVFETGTCLKIQGVLVRNKHAANPNQFDYKAYLEQKQLYAQLYSTRNEIAVGTQIQKDIWYYTSKLTRNITRNLEQHHFSKRELSVAVALIMGQRQDVSPEIIQDYQFAGAIHILSVSGLHVGFILLFLNQVLKPIPNSRRGTFIKLVIIISALWLFALIAGMSASVVRSATMFSFIAVGFHLRRTLNIYHTLIVSILLILLFQPNFLLDVGFQLSYCAAFFIIWFQPFLAALWSPKRWILKYIWGILTVSVAAQLGTMPLSIYYFHQFPGLFFITNLLIIPLLSFIMIIGVLVLSLATFNYVPFVLAKPFEMSIYFMNKIIATVASFESFIIQDIPLNTSLLIGFYLLLISSIVWLKKPSFYKLIAVLVAIIMVQLCYIKTNWDVKSQKEWVVFNLKKQTNITERRGENVILYQKKEPENWKENSQLRSYLVANFSKIEKIKKLSNLTYFNGNRILILDSLGWYPKAIYPDIVVLTHNPKFNLDRMLELLKPKIVVADGSNSFSIQKKWKASCLKQKIPFHATAEKGFFKLN